MKNSKSKKSLGKSEEKNQDIRSMFNKNSKIAQDFLQSETKVSEFKEKREEEKVNEINPQNKTIRKFSEVYFIN